jgi:flagellar M-ring protein FliF
MNFFQRLRAQAADFWAGLGTARRLLLVAVTVGVLFALGAVAYLQSATTGGYVTLFGDLPLDQAGAVDTRLTALGIPHRLEAAGSRITVPEDRLAQARVALAAENLPSGGGRGYELFDETSIGATPFVQNVNYQRALQAELARSIMQLDPVQSARVLVARPDPSPFVRDQRPPTASVVIRLKPRTALSPSTAASIVSLVARSVEGLKPENVTVVDSNGRLLSDPHAGEREDVPAAQIEYRRELENHLAQKAEEMLARSLGPGRAVVRVSTDVNFQKLKEHRETYSPDERVASAERTTSTKTTAGPARGVVGAASNVARAGATLGGGGGGGGGQSTEEVIQTDYLVSRTVRDLEDRMGAVTRLTVAVLADLSPAEGQPAGPTLTLEDAQEIVKQAVGFRTGRDEIKVSNVKLAALPSAPEPDEEAARIARLQAYVSLARNVCLAIAVVLALAVPLLLLLRRRRPLPAPVPPPPEETAARAAEARRQAMLDRFADMARSDPDRLARSFGMLIGTPTAPATPAAAGR